MPYLYSHINIQSKKLYQVYGSPIFERIIVHMQRYLHQAFNEKNLIFQLLSSDCEITWQWLFISIYACHKLLIVLKISFILVIYWDKKPLSCYFTISTQQLKNQIFSLKASWRYLCIWTLILSNIGLPYTWYSFFDWILI